MADATRTIVVEFKGETTGLTRAARRAADDVEDAGRRMDRAGKLIASGLGPFVDNDIAEVIGANLAKIPAPALAAAGAITVLAAAAASTAAMGALAGGALLIVGKWLYESDPTSPLAQAVDDVRTKMQDTADTVRLALGPVFDDLATQWGPIVIDMLTRLNDWLINNQDTLRTWVLILARAFTQGTIVATYFGQALIAVSVTAILIMVNSVGALTTALGGLIAASGYIAGSQGMQKMGREFINAGTSAMAMSDDIVNAGIDANTGLMSIRDGAREADGALDELEGDRHVNVIYSTKGFAEIQKQGDILASVIRPNARLQVSGPGARAAAYGTQPVVNVTVNALTADTAMVRRLEPVFRQVLTEIDRRNGVR